MKIITTVLLLSLGMLHAQSDICQTKWIQSEGKKYRPLENVKVIEIEFVNKLDGIKMSTRNHTSSYDYASFIDLNEKLGMSYHAKDGNILDIFKNGDLYIWKGKVPLLKAFCPTLKLDITKHTKD